MWTYAHFLGLTLANTEASCKKAVQHSKTSLLQILLFGISAVPRNYCSSCFPQKHPKTASQLGWGQGKQVHPLQPESQACSQRSNSCYKNQVCFTYCKTLSFSKTLNHFSTVISLWPVYPHWLLLSVLSTHFSKPNIWHWFLHRQLLSYLKNPSFYAVLSKENSNISKN